VTAEPVERVRRICLALPEAYEEETWGAATFRVRKKIFCMAAVQDPARPAVSLKVGREDQQALLAQGDPFFFPAYVGAKGWIGVDLTSRLVDWTELEELVTDSYRLIAPKKLAAQATQTEARTLPGGDQRTASPIRSASTRSATTPAALASREPPITSTRTPLVARRPASSWRARASQPRRNAESMTTTSKARQAASQRSRESPGRANSSVPPRSA
jgi:predicted DNA-binding protein (MmcQ/YjbR family)